MGKQSWQGFLIVSAWCGFNVHFRFKSTGEVVQEKGLLKAECILLA